MKIELAANLPAKLSPGIVCRFAEAGTKYASSTSAGFAPPDERPLTMRGQGTQLYLTVNIDAHRNYERDEARRVAAAASIRQLNATGLTELLWLLDGEVPAERFRQLVAGALLVAYRYEQYKAKPKSPAPELKLIIIAGHNLAAFKADYSRLKLIDDGVSTSRNLSNAPANDLTPEDLAAYGKRLAAQHGMAFTMLNARELAAGKYAGITAVGGGSTHPPVLFSMAYKPAKTKRGAKPLCLVGKGLTFDSGGLSIKPWEGMWDMKADMGGAAGVLGAMQSIAALKLPVEVLGVVGSAENMPDGRAYRPGDILRYRNGRTVEIQSTDAEGRLVLADALLYAQETLKQHRIVELSTLTGACARALGQQYIGLMSRSPELAAQVKQAAAESGEAVWELPLSPEYRSLIDSSIADIRNVGGPLAGAQTAGWFLQEFIENGTEYVHLDIAGVFMADKEHKYWGQLGATGAGVRLAVALAGLQAR